MAGLKSRPFKAGLVQGFPKQVRTYLYEFGVGKVGCDTCARSDIFEKLFAVVIKLHGCIRSGSAHIAEGRGRM